MRELRNTKLIVMKGLLFMLAGALASVTLIVRHPQLITALLLVAAIWCSARSYYFGFYVIEKYVDPNYRYSGIISLVRQLVRQKQRHPEHNREESRVDRDSRSFADHRPG